MLRVLVQTWAHVVLLCAAGIPGTFRINGTFPEDMATDMSIPRTLDILEIFEGIGSIRWAAVSQGYTAVGFDKNNDAITQNVMTPEGWQNLVGLAMAVKVGGLVWMAPECSWWVFASSSHHRRYERIEGASGTNGFPVFTNGT